MQRKPKATDAEWEVELGLRKKQAEEAMQRADNMKGLLTLDYLTRTAAKWETDLHSAEIRLLRGEMP